MVEKGQIDAEGENCFSIFGNSEIKSNIEEAKGDILV